MTLPELLADPVRARIYVEVLLNKEITAQELMDAVSIQRSTMSHHLSRFVQEGVLKVRIESTGRVVKYYSINPDYEEEVIAKGEGALNVRKRLAFLESASAHLLVISNLILEQIEKLKTKSELPRGKKRGRPLSFTKIFISDAEAEIWIEEYMAFEKRFKERCSQERGEGYEPSFDYIAFCGLTPTRKLS